MRTILLRSLVVLSLVLIGCSEGEVPAADPVDPEEPEEPEQPEEPEEPEQPEEPEEPEEPTSEELLAALIADYHLDGLACEETEPYGAATVALWCWYHGADYELHLYTSQSELRDEFREFVEYVGVEPQIWRQDTAEGPRGGSVIAYLDTATDATMVWTQESGLVMGFAWWVDDDDLAGLIDWWSSDGSFIENVELLLPHPLSSIEVGTCIRSAEGSIEAVGCDDATAEAEVLSVTDDFDAECGADSDRNYAERTTKGEVFQFCLASLVDPATDQVLDIGSCIELEESADDSADVYEVRCDDPSATHTVLDGVASVDDCPEDYTISKSDEEIERSGEGEWCLMEW